MNTERDKIINYLFIKKVNVRSVGFNYLTEAIVIARQDPLIRIGILISELAKWGKISPYRVEKNMRYAIQTSEDDITQRQSMGEFIKIAAIVLNLY
ncbi:MAG: sporulation initiation factor Spo0A C-terminal domain-containing protein [Firmicutes bacterium]|nr:sporulation initiation factor Spo0A C-terminal domain-containing protein [Bacillota bacterium]